MYCKNCGSKLEEGYTFCKECGSPVENQTSEEISVQQTPVAEETPVVTLTDVDTSADGTVVEPAGKPKKSKKGIAIALAAVIALGGVAFAARDAITAFFVGFSSPEKQLQYSYAKLAGDISETYGDIYSEYEESVNESAGVDASIDLEVSETVMNMISYDLDEIGKLTVDYSVDAESSTKMSTDMTFKYAGKELFGCRMYMDMEDEVMVFGMPGITDECFEYDLSELGYEMEASLAAMENMEKILPSEKLVKKVAPLLVEKAFLEIDDVDESDDELTVNGVSQDATCLEATIDSATVYKMGIAVLEELKDNKDVKKYIRGLPKSLEDFAESMGEDLPDGDEFYDEYVDALDEAIDSTKSGLKYIKENDYNEEIAVVNTWVDSSFNILAIEFAVDDSEFFMGKAENKGKSGIEISYKDRYDSVEFIGESVEKNGFADADFTFDVDGYELFTVKVKDYDVKGAEKGKYKGSVEIVLKEDLMYELGSYDVDEMAIDLSFDYNDKTSKLVAGLEIEGIEIATLSLDAESRKAKVKAINGDTDDYEEWAESFDFDGLMDTLEDVLPEELYDVLYEEFFGYDDYYGYDNYYGGYYY